MKKLLLFGIIFSLLIQTGCTSHDEMSVEVIAPTSQSKHNNLEIYVEEEVTLGPYEPTKGIYLGAYVEGNIELTDKMNTYEELFKAEQVFRVFQFTEEAKVTDQDLLRCIAEKKVPYIKVLTHDNFDMTPIYQMVGSLRSKYKTPIFIELFPVTKSITDIKGYKAYYQNAYEIIKRYLPDSVIVWSMNAENAYESQLYYPGDHLVDWVGLNVYLPRFKEGRLYEPNVVSEVDLWYKTFQNKKPMMISGLAISHFSRVDHTYTIESAKNKLEMFYHKMPDMYPRIKGIIYADIDMAQINNKGMEDYRISGQPQLLDYVRELWKNPVFLHKLEEPSQEVASQYMKYTVPALDYEHHQYVALDYAKALLTLEKINASYLIEDEKGQKYYDISALLEGAQAYYVK